MVNIPIIFRVLYIIYIPGGCFPDFWTINGADFFEGRCELGDSCTFAHGHHELIVVSWTTTTAWDVFFCLSYIGKSPFFNRKCIFIHGGFSIVMLVFGDVGGETSKFFGSSPQKLGFRDPIWRAEPNQTCSVSQGLGCWFVSWDQWFGGRMFNGSIWFNGPNMNATLKPPDNLPVHGPGPIGWFPDSNIFAIFHWSMMGKKSIRLRQ